MASSVLLLSSSVAGQIGTVHAQQKISASDGGLGSVLDAGDNFGYTVCSIGDLDGDGVADMAVGARLDDDGFDGQGAVWILFLNTDGTVKAKQKISETAGGFGGDLHYQDLFGGSVTCLGDLDDDGVADLAVGAYGDDDGGSDEGAVWIVLLHTDGTVKAQQKISGTSGGFGSGLDPGDRFGVSIAAVGDLDGDGIEDVAVGAEMDDDGGENQGAVWILFLRSDGTVRSKQKISQTAGGFVGPLLPSDYFGTVGCLGDVDGDGVADLAVGARSDPPGNFYGAVWVLFLHTDGTVRAEQKISNTTGGLGGVLRNDDTFGGSVAGIGDLDGDRIPDLAVGAYGDDDGECCQRGAVWLLFLNADGTVKDKQKISQTAGGFGGVLDPSDYFGNAVCSVGDLDGDGVAELAVGAPLDDDGLGDEGAVWVLFLEGDTTAPTVLCPPFVLAIDRKGSPAGEAVFFSVPAIDDRDPTPAVVYTPPSGSFFPRGTTPVTCTVTDASGNEAVCTFPVIVMPSIRRQQAPPPPIRTRHL